ncbi:hypothetical protein AB0L41_48845 [Amycolatopsis mediterranei]|uniref:hypothetical protein n=1 Tax=Amycolatopsis mediterranei TaxID=33910 RepID=UPI003422DD0A
MGEALGWPAGLVGFPRLVDSGGRAITINGTEHRARDLRGTRRCDLLAGLTPPARR